MFWAHVVIDPIHDEAGELVGFAKITRDITTGVTRNSSCRKRNGGVLMPSAWMPWDNSPAA